MKFKTGDKVIVRDVKSVREYVEESQHSRAVRSLIGKKRRIAEVWAGRWAYGIRTKTAGMLWFSADELELVEPAKAKKTKKGKKK